MRPSHLPWLMVVLTAICAASSPAARLHADDEPPKETKGAEPELAPLELDDPVEPFQPRRERTEEEQDRLAAMSYFGAARMKEKQDDQAGALRLYQRALRRDENALTVLREIIPLSFELGRTDEAMRYAVKIAELDPSDGLLLRRLGLHLTTQGDLDGALKLYEKALEAVPGDKRTGEDLLLLAQMAKLYFANDQHAESADAFEEVIRGLESPEEYELDGRQRRLILQDAAKTYEVFGDAAGLERRNREAMAYAFFGEAFLAAGRPEAAQKAFEKSHELDPDEHDRNFNHARVLAATGKPAEALERLEAFIAAKTGRRGREPYQLLRELLTELGRGEEIEQRLEALQRERPEDGALGYELAEHFYRTDQLDRAAVLYVRLLKEQPSVEGYRRLLLIHRRTSNVDGLLDVLSESLMQVRSFEFLEEEGKPLADDPKLVASLIETARQRIAAAGDEVDPKLLHAAAAIALEGDDVEAAEQFFNRLIEARPEASTDVIRQWGLGLLLKDRYAESVEVFRRGLDPAISPNDNPEFQFHLAGALEMLGQTDEALVAARRAAELAEERRGTMGDAYFRIISRVPWIEYHAKRYDDSARSYQELIDRFDRTETGSGAREMLRDARLVLSNISVIQGDLPAAEEWLEQILDEFPDDVSALNDLGYLWADQNKHLQRSLAMIQQALEAEPDNQAYRDSLGWALYRLDRYDEAIVELERAADGEHPDPVILDHLGEAYWAAGQHEQARLAWQRAIEGLQSSDDPGAKLDDIRQKLNRQSNADE